MKISLGIIISIAILLQPIWKLNYDAMHNRSISPHQFTTKMHLMSSSIDHCELSSMHN